MYVFESEVRTLRIDIHEFVHGAVARFRRPNVAFVLPPKGTIRRTVINIMKEWINNDFAVIL